MGSKSIKSPPSPDPYQTAAAQTGSNLTTAIGNTWMQNANTKTPWGSTTTRQTGTRKVKDPSTGQVYDVPVFTHTTNLSGNQRTLLNQQEQLGMGLNSLAQGQVNRLSDHLSKPVDLEGLQEVGNFDDYRNKVEGALNTRLDDKFSKDYDALESRLVNQGLTRGSEAFSRAMEEHGRNVNDARVQSFLASGAEARNAGQYDMGLRNNQLSERLTMRNQPINEVTSLMSGGQVNVPQMPGFQGSSMSETPVGQYIYNNWSQNNQLAQQQAQANGQMWSNIGSVAGGLFKWSSMKLKTNIKFVCMDKRGFSWYTYNYIWGGPAEFGVIAEEVSCIIPGSTRSIDGYLAVDYGVIGNVDAEQT